MQLREHTFQVVDLRQVSAENTFAATPRFHVENEKAFAQKASKPPKTAAFRVAQPMQYGLQAGRFIDAQPACCRESWMDRRLLEYRPEIEAFESAEGSLDAHTMRSSGSEMQRAAELLEHAETGELESYLVELIDRVARSPERPVTQALAGILSRTAQRLLQHDGSPSVALAGRVFGLELEGLSAEDQAFEVARRFVRFATEAAQRVQRAGAATSPQAVALRAASSAARTLAPGLLASPVRSTQPTGSWFRRGRQLIVLNP